MKHIVFAHRKLSFGGGERVLLEQVAALRGLPVRVSVLFRKEPGRRDIEAELRTRNPNVGDVRHIPGAFGAFAWLLRARPDALVVCNHKGVQRALPWLARLGRRIPTAVTLHEHYERHLRKYRGIRELVDRWICTYDFTAAVREHLSPAPCAIIHPLYPRPEAQPMDAETRRAARARLGLPPDGPLVGYVGQIDGRKDPVAVLRFAEALARTGSAPALLFAGREEHKTAAALQAALEGSPLRERTRRLGALPDLGDAFAALDLYVMTSRNEGFFPLALIEALERGVPVLAPPVGGIGSILRDGDGGFLLRKTDDRKPVEDSALREAAARLAPLLADPAAWDAQRARAHAFGTALTRDYDAAAKFREVIAPWL
ncbi:glycosyltransferase family 4 protein [Geothrix sp. 21YS21S-4]|uniref:glycosyltransferase family 4 protein n=1 Tax=Geothrix sp. 21YS21S-4 TaxID=3068889 RepID=UPI0027BA31B5|nr:glycosyltransferase family 4 protein [Geothrix sp. 21YS21S-4]